MRLIPSVNLCQRNKILTDSSGQNEMDKLS